MNRIIIITDCIDVAANEIRAVLIAELSKLKKDKKVEIEPIVKAKEFSIINGAFLIRLMAEIYPPKKTIFLVILNSLKTDRKERARVIGETKNGIKFIGANTGTLSWLIKDFGIKQIYESSQIGLSGEKFISFGGKHIHAPIAAKIAAGTDLKKMGVKINRNRLTYLDIKDGTVVHIDNFGVIKIFGELNNLKENDKINVLVNNKKRCVAIFTKNMKNLPDNTWVLYSGSSLNNLPEIGKVRNLNSAKELGVKIGDIIKWKIKK